MIDGPDVTSTWATWAYDREHVEIKFDDNDPGWSAEDIVSIELIRD
jgi:hypothetical protein